LSVPKDVLLTGFADMPVASLMTPSLTTIRQNRDQMGGVSSAALRRMRFLALNMRQRGCCITGA